MWSRKIPAKGGNDTASGCRAPAGAMVVPALLAGQSQAKPYQFVSRADLKMIRIASHSDRGGERVMGKIRLKKARVVLLPSVEAVPCYTMRESSNEFPRTRVCISSAG